EALLTKGNLVDPASGNNLLCTIIPVEPMYVEFYVNQRALEKYREFTLKQAEKKGAAKQTGGDPKIPVEMALALDKEFPHKGYIDFADNEVDKESSAIKVRARFKNPIRKDGARLLMPGMFARVRVAIGDKYEALMVSKSVLLTDQKLKY